MKSIQVKKGCDIRLKGQPRPEIKKLGLSEFIAVKPTDFKFLKPKMLIKENQSVQVGTILFHDKTFTDVKFTSPASGTVVKIKWGARRKVLEILIKVDGNQSQVGLDLGDISSINQLSGEQIKKILLKTGLWPLIRQFPYDVIADPQDDIQDVYVSAFNKEPWLPDATYILENTEQKNSFLKGLGVLKQLANKVIVSYETSTSTSTSNGNKPKFVTDGEIQKRAELWAISGKYPAQHVGAQLYYQQPLKKGQKLWRLSFQDVISIGQLFKSGQIPTRKIISLVGSNVSSPQYLEVNFGSSIASIAQERIIEQNSRFISGGVFTGSDVNQDRLAVNLDQGSPDQNPIKGYLGYYDYSVHVLAEGKGRRLFGFLQPRFGEHSVGTTFPSSLNVNHLYRLSTKIHGEVRPCVQCNYCDKVCPVDILPDKLFKAVLAEDYDESEELGLLDCVGCGLCTYVCPSKIELDTIFDECRLKLLKESME